MKNENRSGYKKTKVGWIPEEWEAKRLGEIFSLFNGYAFSSNDATKEGCRWIKIADVGVEGIKNDTPSFLPDIFRQKHEKFLLYTDDYVVALTRPILNGKLKIAKIENEQNLSLLNQRVGKVVTDNNIIYVFQLLQQNGLISKIENRIDGTDPPNLSPKEIQSILFPLPTLEEQGVIAEVLECWDAGIRSMEKKIELKRNIKKGLMQKLLSGQSRLSGFSGKWETVRLGEIATITKGKQLNRLHQTETGLYPVLNGGINALGFTDNWNTEANTITISEGGNSCGFVNFNKEKFWCGGHCYAVFENSSMVDKWYLFHYLKGVQERIMSLRVGTGLPNIQKKSLASFKVCIPPKAEQRAIADVLIDADTEIEKLEAKLARWKDQKKYLLNELVTGAKRVPLFE